MNYKTYKLFRGDDEVRVLTDLTLPWVNYGTGGSNTLLRDVKTFPNNKNKAIVVGGQPVEIYKTIDAGASWTLAGGTYASPFVNPSPELKTVFIVDSNISYAAGDDMVVVKSIDGGANYNPTPSFPYFTGSTADGYVSSLYFVSPSTGFALITDSIIGLYGTSYLFKTIDGGVSWTVMNGGVAIENSIPNNGVGVYCSPDAQTVVVSLTSGIFVSINGGTTFVQTLDVTSESANGSILHMSYHEDDTLWICGLGGMIRKSTDMGNTWTVLHAFGSSPFSYLSTHFYTQNNGFICMTNGDTFESNDGGATLSLNENAVQTNTIIWTGKSSDSCFTLTSCSGPESNIYNAYSETIDLSAYIGAVVNVDGLGCFTVSQNEDCSSFSYEVTSVEPIGDGSDCSPFEIQNCPVDFGNVMVGSTVTHTLMVISNSTSVKPVTFNVSLDGCNPDITITTPTTFNLSGGQFSYVTIEFTPTVAGMGSCQVVIEGPCSKRSCDITYTALSIPNCPHFNIDITGPKCAPDCIKPGEIVQFNLGGSISDVAYPTIVTISVYNQATNEIIYTSENYVENNNDLDAIVVNIIPPGPGKYCIQVCIPGCNSIKVLCFDVCEPFDIYKDDCNKWHVHKPHQSGVTQYLVTIRELDGNNLITDYLWDTTQDNSFEFELPGDGIYIFEMKDTETKDVLYSFSAFETCELQKCFIVLMDKIMCSCSDPCCKKCTGSAQEEIKFARMTLNKLNPLYMTYLGMARRNELYTYGMKLISDEQMCFLHDASAVLDKIMDLIKDCGCQCKEQKNTATNRGGCSTC